MPCIKYKKHQQFVLDHFKKNNPRGILLYHGLGSGKTITSIGVAELYSNDVVCIVPASMRTQWQKELKNVGVENKRVLLVDDLLATGGTANAALKLLKKSGAKVKSFLCLIELSFLNGKQELDIPFKSLIRY